jgi:hypothetical protein
MGGIDRLRSTQNQLVATGSECLVQAETFSIPASANILTMTARISPSGESPFRSSFARDQGKIVPG